MMFSVDLQNFYSFDNIAFAFLQSVLICFFKLSTPLNFFSPLINSMNSIGFGDAKNSVVYSIDPRGSMGSIIAIGAKKS